MGGISQVPVPVPKVIVGKPKELGNNYGCYYLETEIIKISYELSETVLENLGWYRFIDTIVHELLHHKFKGEHSDFDCGGHTDTFLT